MLWTGHEVRTDRETDGIIKKKLPFFTMGGHKNKVATNGTENKYK